MKRTGRLSFADMGKVVLRFTERKVTFQNSAFCVSREMDLRDKQTIFEKNSCSVAVSLNFKS